MDDKEKRRGCWERLDVTGRSVIPRPCALDPGAFLGAFSTNRVTIIHRFFFRFEIVTVGTIVFFLLLFYNEDTSFTGLEYFFIEPFQCTLFELIERRIKYSNNRTIKFQPIGRLVRCTDSRMTAFFILIIYTRKTTLGRQRI